MGFFDSLTSSGGGGWGDILSGALGLASAYNQQNAQQDYVDMLKQQEKQKYDTELANYNAYNEWLAGYNQAKGSGGGGGSGKKDGALSFYNSLMRPYAKAGKKAVKKASKLYGQGAKGLGLLNAYLSTPQMMAQLQQPVTFENTAAPMASYLPDYMKQGK